MHDNKECHGETRHEIVTSFSRGFGPRTRCCKEEKRRDRHVCSAQNKKSPDATKRK